MAWNDEAEIRCRFQFTCPQQWSRLQPTDKDGVRHCSECDREVHLALTEADVRRFSEQGRCIAVPVVQWDGEEGQDGSCWMVGMMERPYGTESEK